MYALNKDNERQAKIKKVTVRSAKECAFLAVFVAVVIALQLVFSAVPGVELVTVLFVTYSYAFGWKRGVAAATIFSLLRQLIFGFFPTVLVLYLCYYNLLCLAFGLIGKWRFSYKKLPIFVVIACVFTMLFTIMDNLITPLWYGYSARALKVYFMASFSFMIPQVICTAISVSLLFVPLYKAFVVAGKPILKNTMVKKV